MGIQAFLTRGMVFAFMALVVFSIFGAGGGFKATFEFGQLIAQIPVWFWFIIALLWLVSQFRK